jgi:1-hydroxycarotenoid 3,4-desaturase
LRTPRIAVIGAGVAGLASAIDLAAAGMDVVLFDRAHDPGGKMRQITIGGARIDAGPTVFTMRRVFDELFADAGESLEHYIKLTPAALLARHAWSASERLDLFADPERTRDSIGRFAGAREAQGFVRFSAQAQCIHRTLEDSFIRSSRPTPLDLLRRTGVGAWPDLWRIRPFVSLWTALGDYFRDPRLRQLFARYATYCGSSPFSAPATLMLIAHVEQAGVWYVEGGMHHVARQLAALAASKGARLRFGTGIAEILVSGGRIAGVRTEAGERVDVDAVVCNADNGALAAGLFGRDAARAVRATPATGRSLSAVTWTLVAHTEGFDLAHHSVFFNRDYRAEFDEIFRHRRLPASPTIYVCAQDRRDAELDPRGAAKPGAHDERLLLLINAPPTGDARAFDPTELESCEDGVFRTLADCGLRIDRRPDAVVRTSPADFHRLFPATGGALYGPASHGWTASFKRAGSRSAIPGLYLAGGSTHPGPGVPMAATSGRLAAACIMSDYASMARSRTMAMSGGTSMR